MDSSYNINLPPNWTWVKLGDIGDVVGGGTPSTSIEEYFDGDIFWITPADLTGFKNKCISKGRRNITEAGLKNSSARLIPKGSVLFSSRAPIGYVVIASNELCTNQGFKSVIPNKKVDSEFVYYFLKSAKQLAEKNASGTTFKEISAKNFANLPFPLPPLPEQKKIVEKIEELFSGLDNGVASLKKAKAQIRLYRQSVLASAFNGKLIDNQEYDAKLIKDVFELIDGDRGPNYPKRQDYRETGHCLFLSTKNVRPTGFLFNEVVFIDEKKHKELRKGTLSKGDIILTTRGTVGNVAYYDDSVKYDVVRINSGMLILRMKEKNYIPKFVIYYVQSPQFNLQIKQKITGTAQPQLPANILKGFSIPIPSIAQQTQIVEEIEKRFSEADNLEKAIDESLTKSETLRQSILKQAFSGKLKMNN
jgi:type I restriction enzyme, S subunit